MNKIIKTIPLSKTATYSKKRIDSILLNSQNYIGTDNLLQNKKGKISANYVPEQGSVCKYEKGNILISNIRPYLKKVWYADSVWGSSADVLTLAVNKGYNSKFIYYSLLRDEFFGYMMIWSKGTKMPRGDKSQIMNFPISDFDIKRQIKISDVLSALDEKITLNRKINNQLEEMISLFYSYWFVQFDFPDNNWRPYKSSWGKMIYNEKIKREVPEWWEVKELGKVSAIERGKLITATTADLNGKFKVISAWISFSYMHSQSNRKKNTITISGSGANAGYINFWREEIFANDCTTVRGTTDQETLIINEFLKLRQEYILNQARGSAQPHIYPDDISILNIVYPSEDLIKRYGDIVLPFNECIANNLEENQKLIELRDWLLPMLTNGQVIVQ